MKHYSITGLALLWAVLLTGQSFPQASANKDFLGSAIDSSLSPGDDFFNYATGRWAKNNPIPSTESTWGVGNLVQEETYAKLREILEEAAKSKAPKGTNEQKIGDFYFSGMDSLSINRAGISSINPELSLISSITNKKDMLKAVALFQKEGVGPMFGISVDQDAKKSGIYAMYLFQGGLGLPDRDYYFRKDTKIENIRNEYKKHLKTSFELLGEASGNKDAETVYKIETFLADSSRKLEDLRDPYANYNKMSLKNLAKISPAIDWKYLISECGIKEPDSVIVGQPEFFRQLSIASDRFSIAEWKSYLRWQLLNTFAETLGGKYEKENFHFKSTVMYGILEQKPRWKRVQDQTEGGMGELLGQIYVRKYYSPETKRRYERLVSDIMDAFGERIKRLDWMSEETKRKALSKLHAVTRKVGYPDKWKDFSKLSIQRDAYARNSININKFWFERASSRLDSSVDRLEWGMTPQTYNAYYNPSNNEIVLPAAMFIVPGVADSTLDDAIVYSYAGASTIGHELTHGFDDQGRQYDEKGNLANWWTKADVEKFNARTKGIIDQFNSYTVLDSMHINGSATQGENIADLGGLVTGLDAFKKTRQFKEGKLVNGLTPLQRFWLGYAYSWLGQERPERLVRQVMTDVHSPAFLRVNGPFGNIDEFYEAFGIKEGQKMYRKPEYRVKIW